MNSSNILHADTIIADLGADSSTRPFESAGNGDLEAETEASIAKNKDLEGEIAFLRDTRAKKEQTRNVLQEEVLENLRREEELSADISSSVIENKELAATAASVAREVHGLHAMKIDLLKHNEKIAFENQSLNTVCIDLDRELSFLGTNMEETQAAIASVQAEIFLACFEIERLQIEKEEHFKEVSMLHASNLPLYSQHIRFTEETQALSHELEAIASAKALEELRVSDLQAAIVALGVQLSNLTENGTCLRDQILVDQERLRQLEDIDSAMASQETDLHAVVKDLEGQLHAVRTGFDTEGQGPGEEVAIADNLRAFEAGHMEEMAAAESDHNNLQFSSKVQEKDGEARARRAEDLERRAAKLHGENQALAHSNEDLKTILRQQESVIMDSAQLGDSKKLDCGDDEAGETAKSMQVKEAGSVFELQDLTISSHNKQRSSSLMAPLLISGSTIVVVGLLVFLLQRRVRANSA